MTLDKNQIIEAILDNRGRVSAAARSVGCSVKSIYNYRDEHPDVAEAIEAAREPHDAELLDAAESKLLAAVQASEWWAIKFVLTTKGKSRGYCKRKEVEHARPKQIIMQMDQSGDGDI